MSDNLKKVLESLPELVNASNFELQGMEGLDKKLISKVSLDNGEERTVLTLEHLITKESPFTELFVVDELGNTSDRTRFHTEIAWLYFYHHDGTIFKSLTFKDLKLIGTKVALDATKVNSLALQMTYAVDRVS